MNLNNNIEFAKKAEGEVRLQNGNHKLYKCPKNKWTIGYGYNIEDHGLPENIAEILLMRLISDSVIILESNVKFWHRLNDARQGVLIDMCYNMGWPKLSAFKKMFAALEVDDHEEAAKQIMDSNYWVDVTDNERNQENLNDIDTRAEFLVKSMRTGVWQSYK